MPEALVDEANSGRGDLVQRQKDQATLPQATPGQFGNVELVDSGAQKAGAAGKTAVLTDGTEGLTNNLSDKGSNAVLTDFSLFGAPTEEDKQSMRDLLKDSRKKIDEIIAKEKEDEQKGPERKAKVDGLVEGLKDDQSKQRMKHDMETFEHRSPPVGLAQKSRFYDQLGRLMEAKDNPNVPLNGDQRQKLAEQILHKAGDPTTVDQGTKGTCNVATVEARTFTRDPDKAAKVIVDVATTGEYHAPDGTVVKPDPGSIKPDVEVQNAGLFKNPRYHADQIFQVTAVNATWQSHDLKVNNSDGSVRTYPKGTVEYRQTDPVTGEQSGEGLYDKSKNRPEGIFERGKFVDSPHLDGNQMTDLSNTIVHRDERAFVLEHSGPNAADKTFKLDSEQALKDKLKDMKTKGELPAIVMVNTGNPPFWGENVNLKPGAINKSGVNGEHVVTITDYDETTGRVSMDNQWGKGRDHIGASGISTGDLYLATMKPGSPEIINTLDRDVKWNRDHNSVNTSKELELLRQKNLGGQLSEDEYRAQVEKAMADARVRWGDPPADTWERKQAQENYD